MILHRYGSVRGGIGSCKVSCTALYVVNVPYTSIISTFFHPVAIASFSPQNYTLPEGFPAELTIRLDKVSAKDITFTVTTMDITAECE